MQQFLQVYYSTFVCGLTCFRHLPAHHQENTTALGTSGSTESSWSVVGRGSDQQRYSRFLATVVPEAVVCS